MTVVDKSKVTGVHVQLDDGSVWNANPNPDGTFTLLQQITPPPAGGKGKGGGGQSQQQQAPPPPPQKPQPSPFQKAPQSVQDLIEQMKQAQAQGQQGTSGNQDEEKLEKNKLPRVKDSVFRQQLSNVMMDNKFDRRLRGRSRGKLDMKALPKVPTLSRSVFTQKQSRKGKSYNVVFVVDQSGSMSGGKNRVAADAIVFLAEQFRELNISVGVVGFSSEVYVRKELNETLTDKELHSRVSRTYGDTNDYDGLRRGYAMLDEARDGKKILIMLSDGGPGHYDPSIFLNNDGKREKRQLPRLNGSVNYNGKDHLHKLVHSHKDVVSIGIGIYAGGWQIPENFVINNLDELKPSIVRVLKKNIKRG